MSDSDTLTQAQWTALQSHFEHALSTRGRERERFLHELNADDPLLARSLEAMLAAHEKWSERTEESRDDWQRHLHGSALLANGTMVGAYRILGMLGEGGMGVVYRAERADGEVNLVAAIKVLRRNALDAAARERFRRERDLLAGLSHPHIARLFDAGVGGNDQPYFVMEYVQGATIVSWCDERGLDIPARLRLFLDVCGAVQYAHTQLVLHRDIKPGNVLVDAAGTAKLIDFGIAKPIVPDAEQAAQTATAQRLFSPANVAPEQMRGEREGVACDVYQLGTLLYELLCGRAIFALDGTTLRAMEEAILHQAPAQPSVRAREGSEQAARAHGCADPQAWSRQLAGDLDEIVLLALRKEPERRYASVEQLIEDIQRHLDLQPVRARGSSRGYRARLFAKRHWRSLALGAAAAMAAIAFVAALTVQSRQLQRERDLAVTAQRHAESEQHRAEAAIKFLVGVFAAADPKVSMNLTTPIGQVLENGGRKLDTELAGQPQLVADLSHALALIYADIDDVPRAESYARRSLALGRKLSPASMGVAENLDLLGSLEGHLDHCATALPYAREAVDLYRKLGAGVARSVSAQERVIVCEAHERGLRYGGERYRVLLEALKRDPQATPAQIAYIESNAAEFVPHAEAMRLRHSAVDRLQPKPWKGTTEEMQAREKLADALSLDGQFTEAGAMLDALEPDYRRMYGHDSMAYAELLQERGANYLDWKRIREAEADFLEVRRIRQGVRPLIPSLLAQADFNLGGLYEDGLKDLARAGPFYEEAARYQESAAGPKDGNTLEFKAAWAVWLLHVGRVAEARTQLESLRPQIPVDEDTGVHVRLALADLEARSGQRAAADALLRECGESIAAHPELASLKADLDRVRKGGRL